MNLDESTHVYRDLDLLCPKFARKIYVGMIAARAAGHNVALFETWRSPARQAYLYAQGRTAPGKIVTQAQPWATWHNYGLAADLCFLDHDQNFTWEGDFKALVPFFEKAGLHWLGAMDAGHYELTPKGMTWQQARDLTRQLGVQRVWISL